MNQAKNKSERFKTVDSAGASANVRTSAGVVPMSEPVPVPVPMSEPVPVPVPMSEPVPVPVPMSEPVLVPVPMSEPVTVPVPMSVTVPNFSKSFITVSVLVRCQQQCQCAIVFACFSAIIVK